MKVLHVIDTLNVGGAEKMFVVLTTLLRQHNIHCDALLVHNTGELKKQLDPRVNKYTLNRHNKYSLNKLRETHNLCKKYDIVHAHLRHCYAYIRLAQIIFNGKYKIILHDHSSLMPEVKPFRLSGILKPKFYIGVSNLMTNWAKHDLQIVDCYTLPNTIIPPADITYRLPDNYNAILISNIRELKQIPLAIEICKKAGLSLTVYGNRQDRTYYETFTKIADKAGVKIKEGISDFTNVYPNYSIAIHTSRSETGPLVLLEYLANGIPFLAYNTGAVADIVAKELPLHFIDNFNIDDWVERIKMIRSQGDISATLKAVFNKHYSASDYAQQCIKIYQSVLC